MPRITKQVQAEQDLLDTWMYTFQELTDSMCILQRLTNM